ncbi:MAG: cache domain-containing protein [Burkholderiales bacterium]|nr:cache domain-containing protein [Burkholderiales bacterium]
MRRHFLLALLFATQCLTCITPSYAGDSGTPAEAQALVKKAVAFAKANGKQKAIDEFNKAKGSFVDRDLYIFVLDKEGVTLANGVNPKIVGKNVMDMRDTDGKSFIKEITKLSEEKGEGWVDYKWHYQDCFLLK